MISDITEIMHWATFNKQKQGRVSCQSPTDCPSTCQGEHVWIATCSTTQWKY